MIKIEHVEVVGLEPAIRGMRNPMNSWDRSDSHYAKKLIEGVYDKEVHPEDVEYIIGHNDLELMNKLAYGGSVHAKYRRMIVVYMDITAPLYWWKEFDTYKIGTVANSCSTMHKIADKEFTLDDFSHEHLDSCSMELMKAIVADLNDVRVTYLTCEDQAKKKDIWWQMIQLLPSSYNQKRTVMLNYEVLAGIYKHRKDHKLDEWQVFCKNVIENLPYSELITGKER